MAMRSTVASRGSVFTATDSTRMRASSRHQLAGHGLELSLAPTLWEWKRGEGYTLPITHDRKAQLAVVLSGRAWFKIARFVPLDSPALREGRLPELGRNTFRSLLPLLTP